MKHLILIAFLLLIVSNLKAQDFFIGGKKTGVLKTLIEYDLIKTDSTADKQLKFYDFTLSKNHQFIVYFNTDNICTLCCEVYMKNDAFFEAIKDLNTKFIKVDDNNWVNKENTVKITLQKGQEGFSIVYTKT